MSWLVRGRELVFGTYDNLPTIFIAGSLLIGSMTGIVPILILGLTTAFLGLLVLAFQIGMRSIVGTESNDFNPFIKFFSSTGPCSLNKKGSVELLVSSWASITTYVIVYLFLNALANYTKPSKNDAANQLVANRSSYMISAMVALCIIAIILIASRYMLGCETGQMAILSIALGGGVAYGMWNLVDIKMGDVFQIINNMAINSTGEKTTPVMCIPS